MADRQVRFAEQCLMTELDTSEDEAYELYYSRSELRSMQVHAAAIIQSLRRREIHPNPNEDQARQDENNNNTSFAPEELSTMHGVEAMVRQDILQMTHNQRLSHTNAIMTEQRRQGRLRCADVQALAAISRHHSGQASERARAIGFKHYIEREM